MNTQTINKLDIKKAEEEVKNLMSKCTVSTKSGFLSEEPLRHLPSTKNPEQTKDFKLIDEIGYSLEKIIKEKKVTESINKLRVPSWSCKDLPENVVYRLMAVYAMLTHAYFRETMPYKNVNELMKNTS